MRSLLLLVPLLFVACTETPQDFTIDSATIAFDLPAGPNGNPVILFDHAHALDSGFMLPAPGQSSSALFPLRFTLKDTQGRQFRYALFHQNATYKYPDAAEDGSQHPLAADNFYGSWGAPGEPFRLTPAITEEGVEVTDGFRIIGDPREEERFVQDGVRQRWARNPRVGEYEFLLVVLPDEALTRLPEEVRDIRKAKDGTFTNPFWYFLHGPGSYDPSIVVHRFTEKLTVIDRPDLGAGIFVPHLDGASKEAFTAQCGDSPALNNDAPFMQFIHYVDASTQFENIPLIADVLGNEFTPADHDHHQAFFPKERMIPTRPMTTNEPCRTVRSDPERHVIELRNPASTFGNERKENVGVRSRNGLMYGKHLVKCKLTRLLNDSDMWVGLTNAIWLIYQGAPGNHRRICEKDGYMANYWGGEADERVPQVDYAEIDFEILKTPPYCPDMSFPPLQPQAWADPMDRNAWSRSSNDASRGMITVACTNWDMACHSPVDFNVGCHPITYSGVEFLNHRWDHNYRAITQKSEESDAELFGGEFFWFEIDWRPTEILWRIGPDRQHMRLVGYMNDRITSIPDVQMQLIVTQEFHNTKWWPGSPYDQGYIPFPGKDYVGEIHEVIIE